MRALAALLLIAMLGVSGCSTTLFESLPTGASTGCDPAWPGRWQPVATEPGERQHPGSVEVSADCRTLTDNAKAKPLHLTLIDTGKARYVEVRSDSGEPDCIGEGKAHCGAPCCATSTKATPSSCTIRTTPGSRRRSLRASSRATPNAATAMA